MPYNVYDTHFGDPIGKHFDVLVEGTSLIGFDMIDTRDSKGYPQTVKQRTTIYAEGRWAVVRWIP